MAAPYRPGDPDSQEVKLVFPDEDVLLDRWTSYSFSSDFLTPADSFQFTLGLDEDGLPDDAKAALCFGARVQLVIDTKTIATGHVDVFDISADRGGGHVVQIHGRDRLGQLLDTIADPTYQLKDGGTLAQFIRDQLAPFGFTNESDFVMDASADRNAKTGIRGTPTTHGGKKKGPKPLKSFVLHQTKPYNHETVWRFVNRVTQRHGLWIRLSADGTKVLVGKPDYDQAVAYTLNRTRDPSAQTNVTSGNVTLDVTNQPTMIIADTFGAGGVYGKGRFRAYAVNPILGYAEDGSVLPEVEAVLKKTPSAVHVRKDSEAGSPIAFPRSTFLTRAAKGLAPRVMYLHDDESKTQDQIEAFVRREMSLLLRQAIRCHYVVEGHGQQTEDGFVVFAHDTMVHVRDDAAGLDEDMYVLGVRFEKSRGGSGTTTRLDLILPNSIVF